MTMALADGEAKYSNLFATRLNFCLPYSGSVTLEDGTKINRKILSWKENKCRYWEVSTDKKEKKTYTCNFSREDINSLSPAMKADPDGKNSADAVWDLYKQDGGVCKEEIVKF